MSTSKCAVKSWLNHDIDVRYSLVIFDLDNTIYDEYDFLEQVYAHIGLHVSKYGVEQGQVAEFLIQTFKSSGRSQLLQKMIKQFGLPEDCLDDLRKIYYEKSGKRSLSLFQGVEQKLSFLKDKRQILIWTNGNKMQQRLKLDLLRLGRFLDLDKDVLFANEDPKPSPKPLLNYLEKNTHQQVLYYGDRDIDEAAAQAAGVDFCWVDIPVKLPRSL